MVKGVARRVVVVKAPDPRYFEQALFLVREDALSAPGVTEESVVREARRIAGDALPGRSPGRLLRRLGAPAWFTLGAVLASVVWALAGLV